MREKSNSFPSAAGRKEGRGQLRSGNAARVSVCVCVCVRERERRARERGREREREKAAQRWKTKLLVVSSVVLPSILSSFLISAAVAAPPAPALALAAHLPHSHDSTDYGDCRARSNTHPSRPPSVRTSCQYYFATAIAAAAAALPNSEKLFGGAASWACGPSVTRLKFLLLF